MQNLRKFAPAVLFVLVVGVGCRLDMHVQPRYNPLAKSDFFDDHRAARPIIEGTVANDADGLRADTYFYTGKIGGNDGDSMPFAITRADLDRGRMQFNVYCSPCHSRLGDGNGFIPSRGFSRKPPSYHIERLQKVPIGYFFDVMTNGFGIMMDYSAQITPRDRWLIAAYIRALQLSQNATQADVPAGQAIPSKAPDLADPGSGATLPQVKIPAETPYEEYPAKGVQPAEGVTTK